MNRVFEFRNLTPIEAFVLAADSDRATQLFELHLIAHGGRSDTLRWREWPLDQLEKLAEPEQSFVRDALALERDGVLARDAADRWVFVVPLGACRSAG